MTPQEMCDRAVGLLQQVPGDTCTPEALAAVATAWAQVGMLQETINDNFEYRNPPTRPGF